MRSNILAFLALWRIAAGTSCQKDQFGQEVSRLSCGDTKSITRCLMSGIDLADSHEIEQCFVAGGCETADAIVGAVWLDHECQLLAESSRGELRRRADDESSTSTSDDNSDTKTDSKSPATEKPGAAKTSAATTDKTATPASTEAKTTSESSASSESKTPSQPTTASTPSSTSSQSSTSSVSAVSAASASASASAAPGTTIQCSTTKMVSTSQCSFFTDGASSGSKTCSATVTAISRCAPGVICQSDHAGNPICMKADNHLTTSGLIVALIFALGIASFLIAVTVMCMRERRSFKKAEAFRRQQLGVWKSDMEAAGSERDNRIGGKKGGAAKNLSEMNLPLISQVGTRESRATERYGGGGGGGRGDSRSPGQSRGTSPVGGGKALGGGYDIGYDRI